MVFPQRQFRHFREQRLIFQHVVEAPKTLSERIADFVRAPGPDAQLETLIEDVRDTPDKESILAATLDRLRSLSEEEKTLVSANLQNLEGRVLEKLHVRERLLAHGHVREWLARAKEAVSVSATKAPTSQIAEAAASTSPQERSLSAWAGEKAQSVFGMTMGYAEKVTDFVLPERLTESMTPTQKRIFGTAATLGSALLVGWIAHAIFRGKRAAEEKKGGLLKKWVLGLLIGAGALVAGAYGVDWLMDHMGKKMVVRFEEERQRLRESLEKQIEEVRAKHEEATGREREAYGQSIEDLEVQLTAMQSQTAIPPSRLPKVAEIAAEGAVNVGKSAAAKGLLLLYRNDAKELVTDLDRENVAALLQSDYVSGLTVRELMRMNDLDDPLGRPLSSDSQRRALLFIVRVTRRLFGQPHLQEALGRRGVSQEEVLRMRLSDFLATHLKVAQLFGRLEGALEGLSLRDIPNVGEVLTRVFTPEGAEEDLLSDHRFTSRLTQLVPALASDGAMKLFLAFCFAHPERKLHARLRELRGKGNPDWYDPVFADALEAIAREIEGSRSYVRLYAHEETFARLLDGYLDTDLNINDALQLFTYVQLHRDAEGRLPEKLQDSDPKGAFLLQMKVLDIVARTASRNEGIDMRDMLGFRAKTDLPLPEGTRELLLAVGKVTGGVLGGKIKEVFGRLWSEASTGFVRAHKERPEATIAVEGTAGAVGVGAGTLFARRWWQRFHRPMDRKVRTGIARLATRYETGNAPWYLRGSKFVDDFIDETHGMKQNILDITADIEELGKKGGTLGRSWRRFLGRGFHEGSFRTFLDDIARLRRSTGDREVLDICDEIQHGLVKIAQRAEYYQQARFGFLRRMFHRLTFRGVYDIAHDPSPPTAFVRPPDGQRPSRVVTSTIKVHRGRRLGEVSETGVSGARTAGRTGSAASAAPELGPVTGAAGADEAPGLRIAEGTVPEPEVGTPLAKTAPLDVGGPALKLDEAQEIVTGAKPETKPQLHLVDAEGVVRPAGAPGAAGAVEAAGEAVERVDDFAKIEESLPGDVVARFVREGGDAADVPRFARCFRAASKALDVLGIAGDAFMLGFAAYEMHQTSELIGNTPDESAQLRRRYYERYGFLGAEAALGSAGLVVGGMALAGVGGAVLTPIALATLPLGAAVEMGRRWQKWREAKARNVGDWMREYSPEENLSELGRMGLLDRLGVGMDVRLGGRSALEFMEAMMLMQMGIVGDQLYYRSDRFTEDVARVASDAREYLRKRIRALVEQTSVRMPVSFRVERPDGRAETMDLQKAEGELTEEEKALRDVLGGAVQRYFDAKVSYILKYGHGDGLVALGEEAALSEVLLLAEAYGRLAHDRFLAESGRLPEKRGFPDASQAMDLQADAYRHELRRRAVSGVLVRSIAMRAAEASRDELHAMETKRDILLFLRSESEPMRLAFIARVGGENFRRGLPDGDAAALTRLHVLSAYESALEGESERVFEILEQRSAAVGADPSAVSEKVLTASVDILEEEMGKSVARLRSILHFNRPREVWGNLSGERVRQLRTYEHYLEKIRQAQIDLANVEKQLRAPENDPVVDRRRRAVLEDKRVGLRNALETLSQMLEMNDIIGESGRGEAA